MMKVFLLFLVASVYAESQVRETETWMPDPEAGDALVSSGDSPNSSDFDFHGEGGSQYDTDDEDDYDDDYYDDFSGSGAGATEKKDGLPPSSKPDVNDNKIPEADALGKPKPPVNEIELVRENEIGLGAPKDQSDVESNVLMSHAREESIFDKTEVMAAVIVGGAFGLVFAILLILLLVYRMRKKDEGTYDLGKRPIYKKAPTTEIYA